MSNSSLFTTSPSDPKSLITHSINLHGMNLHFNEDKSNFGGAPTMQISSKEDIAVALKILGPHAKVFFSEESVVKQLNIYQWLQGKTWNEIAWPDDYNENIKKIIDQVPITIPIIQSSQSYSERIDAAKVHKVNPKNVLISGNIEYKGMHYFRMYEETEEIVFDHLSDHINGLLIIEGVRQVSTAMTHIRGMPMDGVNIFMGLEMKFTRYIENGVPVFIRACANEFFVHKSAGQNVWMGFQVIQNRQVKAHGCARGISFRSKQEWQDMREQFKEIYNKTNK